MTRSHRSTLIGAVVGLLTFGSLLLTQCSSGSGGIPNGPGMLYFYAEW